jgi:Transglutaminase-like superfamily
METPQEYYSQHGPMSAGASGELRGLPRDVKALCEIAQRVLIHRDMAPFAYGLKLTEKQRDDAHLRVLPAMLARVKELSAQPITATRDMALRMPAVCRHFSLMVCGMLREQGIPARARCGFGSYFNPGKFEDHWVSEYWNEAQRRWILVDAQLDAVQRKLLKIDFDPLDVPRDRFIVAGDAWQTCRSGRADPALYGLSFMPGLLGMWFIAGNVVRDLASLNRMEMLPWDVWGGLMPQNDAALTTESVAMLDRIAALTIDGDEAFPELRNIYENDDRLRVTKTVFNALRNAAEPVAA